MTELQKSTDGKLSLSDALIEIQLAEIKLAELIVESTKTPVVREHVAYLARVIGECLQTCREAIEENRGPSFLSFPGGPDQADFTSAAMEASRRHSGQVLQATEPMGLMDRQAPKGQAWVDAAQAAGGITPQDEAAYERSMRDAEEPVVMTGQGDYRRDTTPADLLDNPPLGQVGTKRGWLLAYLIVGAAIVAAIVGKCRQWF